VRCARCFEDFDREDPVLREYLDRRSEARGEDGSGVFEERFFCSPCVSGRAQPAHALDVEHFFSAEGPLARGNSQYEVRPGQVQLARAVQDALFGDYPLLAEGPCGIGKGKAYGVPAAHLAAQGKRVMIVTASIALQEQLVKKDLPDLARELGVPFTFALMKGRNNFLCLEQLEALSPKGLNEVDAAELENVLEWAEETETGDRAELLIKPKDVVWQRFSTGADECGGSNCASYANCFAMAARAKATRSGIIVTNYHMLFLNIATGGRLLPLSDYLILDEAHEAGDIARRFFGFTVTETIFKKLAKDAAVRRRNADLGAAIANAAAAVFSRLLAHYETLGPEKLLDGNPLPFDCGALQGHVDRYVERFPRSHLCESAQRAMVSLREALTSASSERVYTLEVPKSGTVRRVQLVARFLMPGKVLATKLWPAYQSVVAVSATLTTDGKFDFAREELGAPDDVDEIIVETPFDFARQALFVTPPAKDLPSPNDPEFLDAVADRVTDVIVECGGRTMALFTSFKVLEHVYSVVSRRFGTKYRILCQGRESPGELARVFKSDVRSVLLATTSFWTGIDVPGAALTGLVIDRLPFATPNDPVVLKISQSRANAFAGFVVPRSILALRQGVGRLIRTQSDVGVVVLLDRRLATTGYGARFLRSLPEMERADSTAAIGPFLRSRGVPV
jgi:ATP-dependent DNA helicase DinG